MSLLYSLPSILALLGKLIVLLVCWRKSSHLSKWFIGFFSSMLLANIVELTILNHQKVVINDYILIVAYYSFGIFAAFFLFAFCLELNDVSIKRILLFIIPMCTTAQISLLSGYAIVGVESLDYSIVRVSGPFYWVIQVMLVSCFFMIVYTLYACYKKEANEKNWLKKSKSQIIFVSLIPPLIIIILVIIAMKIGLKINPTVTHAAFSTYIIFVIIFTESTTRVSLFMSKLPGSEVYKIDKKIKALIIEGAPLKKINRLFDKSVITRYMQIYEFNEVIVAQKLDLSVQTLKRRLKEE